MSKRTTSAYWTGSRWRINVQDDGVRRSFYSAKPGRAGQREVHAKADRWLDEGVANETRRMDILWTEYLAAVKQASGTSNYDQIRKFGENYILPVIGHIQIGKLNSGHLQDVLNRSYKNGVLRKGATRRSKGPLSRKTLQGIRATELNFLKWARQHKYTTLHPEDLQVPRGARLKEKRILQPDTLKVLFACDTRLYRGKRCFDDFIYAYRFLVATGIRPGELAGLRIGDVQGNTVNLSQAVNRYGEHTQGKNDNAVRSFVMNTYALAAYQAQLKLLLENGESTAKESPLFPMYNQQTLYTRWKSYQESNGMEPISLYELRHTFVSMAQDLPDGKLKMVVGHSANMDTRGIYGHQRQNDARDAADRLTVLFVELLA